MASLTHVCMWSDNGWKRITAEQAARLHPGGTVSAHSGLFMCELCGQYIELTGKQALHIRHLKSSRSASMLPQSLFPSPVGTVAAWYPRISVYCSSHAQ